MAMPKQKPGRSEQIVATPWAFIAAVEKRFGEIRFDLAATAKNCKQIEGRYYGPGSPFGEDALTQNWNKLRGNLWLNPPYSDIYPWAEKCYQESGRARYGGLRGDPRIYLLVPASTGSTWFAECIFGKALVLFLKGRITFEGHDKPYPKDTLLAVYGERPGVEIWDWRK